MAKVFLTNNQGIVEELKRHYKEDHIVLVQTKVYNKEDEINEEVEEFSLNNYPFSYYDDFKISKIRTLDAKTILDIYQGNTIVCAFSSDIFGMLAFAKLMEESNVDISKTLTLDTKWYYKKNKDVIDFNFYPTEWYLGVRMGQYTSTMSRMKFGKTED